MCPGGLGSGRSKSNAKTSEATGDFPKGLLPTSKDLVLNIQRAEFETHFDSNARASCFFNLSFSLLGSERKGDGTEWSSGSLVPSSSPSQVASDAPASEGNNFNSTGPTQWRGKWGTGCGDRPGSPGFLGEPRTTFCSAQPGVGGAGEREATSPRPGSRPRAASPSARASSGCSPPQTPARLWLTAPCGAAGEWAPDRTGPGRGWSCGAAAAARDARDGGDPVRLVRARTRTRAHLLVLPHAADVPFLNLRNVFPSARERVRARARVLLRAPRGSAPPPRCRSHAPLLNPACWPNWAAGSRSDASSLFGS